MDGGPSQYYPDPLHGAVGIGNCQGLCIRCPSHIEYNDILGSGGGERRGTEEEEGWREEERERGRRKTRDSKWWCLLLEEDIGP